MRAMTRWMLAGLMALAMGCDGEPMDTPSLALQRVSSAEVELDVEVLVDVAVQGCRSGVARLQIYRDGEVIYTEGGGADRVVSTRVAVPIVDVTAPDGWPARIEIEGAVSCLDGAEARSAPVAIDVVPARARYDGPDVNWPSYQFWPQPDGTVLFCEAGAIVRVDLEQTRLAASGDIGCRIDTTLFTRVDRLVFVSGDEVAVLDRRTLAVLFAVRGDDIDVGQHRLALLRHAPLDLDRPPELEVVALDDGASLGRWVLDGPARDQQFTPPHIDRRTGYVEVLTVRVDPGPLTAEVQRWRIDPEQAEVPAPTSAGPLDTRGGALVIPSPPGWQLSPAHALLAHADRETNGVQLTLRDLETGEEGWSVALDAPPRMVPVDGHGMVVYAGPQVVRVDADGTLVGQWRAPENDVAVQPAAHRDGGVIASVRDFEATEQMLVFLDAALEPVWQMPYGFAFGAAFDADGGAWIARPPLMRLHPATTYLERTR